MKAKTLKPSRQKLSFTVDRSEFDISSDWVQAVMAPPGTPPRSASFFDPAPNNATDADKATDIITAPGEQCASEADNTCVVPSAPVVYSAPVALIGSSGELNAPVANSATGSTSARVWKLRPLRRITDGLTPGQYAVYSLMLESSEPGQGTDRIYRGGYADLCRLTGLSKRGVQNVVGELQQKAVVRLHTAPGHHRLQTSAYEVPQQVSVLQTWYARGWRFAVGKSKKLTQGATVALSAPVAPSTP